MKIGVISDSHGDFAVLERIVVQSEPVDLWLHGGDYCKDGMYLSELTGLPVTIVSGNCDRTHTAFPDQFLDIAGKHIWMTHGHRYNVKDGVEELIWWAKQYHADVVVYGHTHVAYCQLHEGILIMNPGSPKAPRAGTKPSYGIIHISDTGKIDGQIIDIKA